MSVGSILCKPAAALPDSLAQLKSLPQQQAKAIKEISQTQNKLLLDRYDIIVGMGAAKAVLPWQKVLFMGVVAGVYIGIGGLLALTVGGACPGEHCVLADDVARDG